MTSANGSKAGEVDLLTLQSRRAAYTMALPDLLEPTLLEIEKHGFSSDHDAWESPEKDCALCVSLLKQIHVLISGVVEQSKILRDNEPVETR